MKLWLIVLSPFILGAVIVGTIKGLAAYDKWRAERDRRIRDFELRKWNITPWIQTDRE